MIDDFPQMRHALQEARFAAARGEIPVGAVVTSPSGRIIAAAGNDVMGPCDPTGHAEIRALRKAADIMASPRLDGCDLYVTLEPCAMCAQAISLSRIRRLYYGAEDPKSGGITVGARVFSHKTTHHKPEIYGGILESQCAQLLKDFFAERR